MSGSWIKSLRDQLADKTFRDAYIAEDIRTGIAFQIRALRESRGLSQVELGTKAGKAQSAIARLENPDYGRYSLTTLLEIASTFDVALLVRFVAFSELIARNQDLSPHSLAIPSFSEDVGLPPGAAAGAQSPPTQNALRLAGESGDSAVGSCLSSTVAIRKARFCLVSGAATV